MTGSVPENRDQNDTPAQPTGNLITTTPHGGAMNWTSAHALNAAQLVKYLDTMDHIQAQQLHIIRKDIGFLIVHPTAPKPGQDE